LNPTSLNAWIAEVLADDSLSGMGHGQHRESGNLGLGWLYYGMARVVKPTTAVVIGSYRGFAPLVFGRALADNGSGKVVFIDPSLVDNFWRQPDDVRAHFAKFGVNNIEHHCLTTQDFVTSAAHKSLNDVGLVFIDGYHSHEQARFDFEAFEPLLSDRGVILFHDSIRVRPSRIYGADKVYEHRVRDFMLELSKDASLQVFDVPFGDGLTLVRKSASGETLFK
jgi:predicted O-methyltransferase YrrM